MVGKTTLYTDGTFIINELKADRNTNIGLYGDVVEEYDPWDETHDYVFTAAADRPWHSKRASIRSVKFESMVMPTCTDFWFNNCTNLRTFDSNGLITANTTSMMAMFQGCSAIRSIDVSAFSTANVTSMQNMFSGCSSLLSLDLSSFSTLNVRTMSGMMQGCSGLGNVNVRSFDTRNVTNMWRMFYNCTALVTIYASNKFTTASVTESNYMFYNDTRLRGGRGTTYNSSYVDKLRAKMDGGTADPGYFSE